MIQVRAAAALRWRQFGIAWCVMTKFSIIPLKQYHSCLFGSEGKGLVFMDMRITRLHLHRGEETSAKTEKQSHQHMLDRKLDLPPK